MVDKPIHQLLEELIFTCNQCGKVITLLTAEKHYESNTGCNSASARRVIQHPEGEAHFPKGSMN